MSNEHPKVVSNPGSAIPGGGQHLKGNQSTHKNEGAPHKAESKPSDTKDVHDKHHTHHAKSSEHHHHTLDSNFNPNDTHYESPSAPPEKTWKQNPYIPAAVLGGGVLLALGMIVGGNKSKTISQRAMEARVVAQGTAAVGLLAAGIYGMSASSEKRTERGNADH